MCKGITSRDSGGILGISFGSINSGLPKDIVQQILKAEQIPMQKMEEKKGKIQSKKELVAQLTSKVEAMRGSIFANKSERSFRELMVKVSGNGIDATIDKNVAEPGSYQIEVLQLAQKSSAISNGVEDKDGTYLGVGYLQYELPNGETKEVYIDSEHSSLSGIAKLINKDSDNGMHATVVNSGDGSDEPWKLIISLEDTGDANEAFFPNLYMVDGDIDVWFDNERKAQDAKIKLDGFEIELPSNRTSDVIPGVTIDLKKAQPGEEISLEIEEDSAKIAEKIDTLVTGINDVLKFIKEQNNMDESTDTSSTLGGDLTLQTIETKVRNAIFKTIQTDFGPRRIGNLGITFQKNGLIAFDKNVFQSKVDANYDEAAQIITGKYSLEEGKIKGFIDNLEDITKNTLSRPSGVLHTRKEGLESQIKQIDRKIARKQRQIDKKEQMLKQKFARLEETISRIQTQGAGLAGMAAGSAGFNPVQQLG